MTVALLAQREPAFSTTTRIEPEQFGDAATVFSDGQAAIAGILAGLGGALAGGAATVGSDHTADVFGPAYYTAADGITDSLRMLHELVGDIAHGLAASATDHARADAITRDTWSTTAYTTYTAAASQDEPPAPPDIADLRGAPTPHPRDPVGDVWAVTDGGKVSALLSAWRDAQGSVRDLKRTLGRAMDGLVADNHGPDVQTLAEFWSHYTGGEHSQGDHSVFTALDDAFTAIVTAVRSYDGLAADYQPRFEDALSRATQDDQATPAGPGPAAAGAAAIEDLFNLGHVEQDVHDAVAAVNDTMLVDVRNARWLADLTDVCVTALQQSIGSAPAPSTVGREAWQVADQTNPSDVFTDPKEQAVADRLQANGHVVMHVYEDHSKDEGRNTDSLVDGHPVEFKSLGPGSKPTTIGNGLKKSQSGGGQSDEVYIDTRNVDDGSRGLFTKQAVEQQLAGFFTRRTNGNIQRVTVLLPDGTTATWPPGYGGL